MVNNINPFPFSFLSFENAGNEAIPQIMPMTENKGMKNIRLKTKPAIAKDEYFC